MNILHIINSHKWTGPAEPIINLSKSLIGYGHKVIFCCDTRSGTALADIAGKMKIPIEGRFILSKKFRLKHLINDINVLREVVKSNNIELVNCHLANDHIITALSFKKHRGLPRVVRTAHNLIHKRSGYLMRILAGSTDGFITVSQHSKNIMINKMRIPEEKIKVIYGGVDTDRYNPAVDGSSIKKEFKIMPDEKVIGMVARFRAGRGHRLVIEAFREIKRKSNKAKLMLVGRGEELDGMKKLTEELGIENDVIFTGYRQDDLPRVYAAMDLKVFIEPGGDWSCRAVLEAMSMGLPVVSVDNGVLAETVENGVSGYLVKKTKKEISDAVLKIISDREISGRMRVESRRIAESGFSNPANQRKTEKHFMNLLKP